MRIHWKRSTLSVSVGVFAALTTSFSPNADAQLITFAFEGVVTSVGNPLGLLDGSVFVGADIKGSYTFDTSVMSAYGDYAFYEPPNGIRVDVGNYRFQSALSAPELRIDVTNDRDGIIGADVYLVRSRSNESIGAPLDLNILENSWWLQDPVGDPFSRTDLPTIPPDPSQWGLNLLLIQGFDPQRPKPVEASIYIAGQITSLYVVPTRIVIPIDIKPGSDINDIKPMSPGLLPVVVFGSPSFDVLAVDPATVRFGPKGAPLAHRNGPHFEDIDGDGYADLIAHFRVRETGLSTDDAKACLMAQLADGSEIEGCDSIRTLPQ